MLTDRNDQAEMPGMAAKIWMNWPSIGDAATCVTHRVEQRPTTTQV
jgi:hypothetical protein